MSQIEWCDKTWNPTVGCTRVSLGCDNCYAVAMTRRLEAMGQEKYAGLVNPGKGHFNGVARLAPEALALPLSWKKPARVFVNSMSDLFHEALTDADIAAVFGVMAACPHLTFQVLTKRPERAAEWYRHTFGLENTEETVAREASERFGIIWDSRGMDWANYFPAAPPKKGQDRRPWPGWPLPNVWLGVSVENQDALDRAYDLRSCPAAVRFISYEPALEGVDFYGHIGDDLSCPRCEVQVCAPPGSVLPPDCICSVGIDWIIAGGESGPGARPPKAEWFRSVRDQCAAAGVPFLFKQWGYWCPYEQLPEETKRDLDASGSQLYTDPVPMQPLGVGKKWAGRELDEAVHDEFPAELA